MIETNNENTEINVGDVVESVSGFFTDGLVESIDDGILTIRWRKDTRQEENIDFVQKRSSRIVKKVN